MMKGKNTRVILNTDEGRHRVRIGINQELRQIEHRLGEGRHGLYYVLEI